MTRAEYEAFCVRVREEDNRCACCRELLYECPSWRDANPVEDQLPPAKPAR